MQWLSKYWARTELFVLKIWWIKSGQSVHISRKLTTFCGHSSWEPQEEVSLTRDIHFKEEVIGVTENNSLTTWFLAWFDSLFKQFHYVSYFFIATVKIKAWIKNYEDMIIG
jgi:hypothetical protein